MVTGAISFRNGNGFFSGFFGGAGAVGIGATIGFVGLGGGALGTFAGIVGGLGFQLGLNAMTVGDILDTGGNDSDEQSPNDSDGLGEESMACS